MKFSPSDTVDLFAAVHMAEQYVHTLIPRDAEFCPKPGQVVSFLDGLSQLGAAPSDSKLIVMKPSGRLRPFTDPLTGETKYFPARDRVAVESAASVASIISELQDYSVALEGQGPPRLCPFPLYGNDVLWTEDYGFDVRCCLRPEPVSMSDASDGPTAHTIPHFGQPCGTYEAAGQFRHPNTDELMEVVGVGCARFWLEFEFGKWLLPRIDDSLHIMNPAIVELAVESFGIEFEQGLHLV